MPRLLFARAAAVVSGVLVTTVLYATPAHADHVGLIARDGSRCSLGEWATGPSGVGVRLFTEKASIEIDTTTGDLTYTCHFDVPVHVAREDHFFGREWNLPGRAVKFDVTCWPPTYPLEATPSTEGGLVITPSGRGILTCTFLDFMSRTWDPTFPD